MKKNILFLSVLIFIGGIILSSCLSSAEKADKAKLKVEEAKYDLGVAQNDLTEAQQTERNEYNQFKIEAEEKLDAHAKSVAEFKARIATEKNENKVEYENKIAELDKKNSDLKKRLDEYKEAGTDQWESFKTEFNRDMDKLGEAFKNLTVKNVK